MLLDYRDIIRDHSILLINAFTPPDRASAGKEKRLSWFLEFNSVRNKFLTRSATRWLNPTDPNRIDADGKLIWRDGVASVAFGAQAGTSLADLAANDRGFLEWVLRKDFSDEVKALVRDALAGQFPVRSETESA